MMQRVLSTMQFLWVLGQALVDGLTHWLHTFTRHHSAMSDVLRAKRYLLTQKLLRVGAARLHPITRLPPWPAPLSCTGERSRAGTTSTALSPFLCPAERRGAPGSAGPAVLQ